MRLLKPLPSKKLQKEQKKEKEGGKTTQRV